MKKENYIDNIPKINNVYYLGVILKYKDSGQIFKELKFINNIYMPVSTIFEGMDLRQTTYKDVILSLSSNNIVLLDEVNAKATYMSKKRNYDMVRNINEESNFIKKSRIHEVIDEVKRKGYSIQELNDLKSYINFEEENKKIK